MATILVVDDEAPVRLIIREVLERCGHTVLEARTGRDAFDIYQNEAIDLIITDLVMPEKSGIDLMMELKKRNPGVRIIAVSGGGGITGRFDYLPIAKLLGARAIIRKPFTLQQIEDTVSEALQYPGAAAHSTSA